MGNSGVYEAGDQRTVADSEIEEQKKENRFHEGKDNSHKANDASMLPPLALTSYYERSAALILQSSLMD